MIRTAAGLILQPFFSVENKALSAEQPAEKNQTNLIVLLLVIKFKNSRKQNGR